MHNAEVIDLTASDSYEIIVLDPKTPVTGSSNSTSHNERAKGKFITVEEVEAFGVDQVSATETTRKKKRSRRKKKKCEAEEGEIIEAGTLGSSVEVSREHSRDERDERDGADTEDSSSNVAAMMKSQKDEVSAENPDQDNAKFPPQSTKEKGTQKSEKKRKRRERDSERGQPSSKTNVRADASALFFVDDQPEEVSTTHGTSVAPSMFHTSEPVLAKVADASSRPDLALLLPPHVSVLADGGNFPIVQITAPVPADSDDEDYIDYIDYDDDRKAPGTVRYFDDIDEVAEAKLAKATRIVCKKCGAEGEHKSHECPVLICLTCGARDEHGTRSCPISKTCFTCGMKGHINRDCPNRYTSRGRMPVTDDCDRCGSTFHDTKQCPTIWRIYEYVDDAERRAILEAREKKRTLELGEGGEGYIGPEDWCYNCGGFGHLGDDCQVLSYPADWAREPSAFGEYNTRSGPFSDAKLDSRPQSKAARYAEQANGAWGDGYGSALPLDVGRKGKQKEKARMEKRAREQEDDDRDDWFANRAGGPSTQSGRERGSSHSGRTPKSSRSGRADKNKKISFGNTATDDDRYERDDRNVRDRDRQRDSDSRSGRDRRRDDRRSDRSGWNGLPEPIRETDSIQIRGAAKKDPTNWGVSIRGAASRHKTDREADSRDELYEQRRHERSRGNRDKYDRRRDAREASPLREPRYRGGYSR